MKRILVISVHPDDETLGCGGTLLKHRARGDEINWCVVTAMSESTGYSKEKIAERKTDIFQVEQAYGFTRSISLNLPPAGLDALAMKLLIDPLAQLFEDLQPDTLYLPFQWDVHSDHRIVFHAAWSCAKSFRAPYIRNISMMETLSETEAAPPLGGQSFVPNRYVDISGYMDRKIQIMNIYKDEVQPSPFPRSEETIRSLARYRGAAAGCEFAEAFMVLKEIW